MGNGDQASNFGVPYVFRQAICDSTTGDGV